jgi:hypothetical protein
LHQIKLLSQNFGEALLQTLLARNALKEIFLKQDE